MFQRTSVTIIAFVMSSVLFPGVTRAQLMRPAIDATRAQQLQQVERDPIGYAATLVSKWESEARAGGRWNETAASDLLGALVKLTPDNLMLAGEATSYKGLLHVLATGRPAVMPSPEDVSVTPIAQRLGDFGLDSVFTAVTPCRIADTRVAGGLIAGNSVRTLDLDGGSLSGQGGSVSGCGLPFGAVSAAALTVTVTGTQGAGYLTAYGLTSLPLAATLTYGLSDTISSTTIVPIAPGAGNDFSLYTFAATHAVVDVVGYYAAPAATPLDCTIVASATTTVPYNVWTNVDAVCPVGRTAAGGGSFPTEGTLGQPGIWALSSPASSSTWRTWVDNQTGGSRTIQTWATCCRVPGR